MSDIQDFITTNDREMKERGYAPLGWGSYHPEKAKALTGGSGNGSVMSNLGGHWNALYASRELNVSRGYQDHFDVNTFKTSVNPMCRIYIMRAKSSSVYMVPPSETLAEKSNADTFVKDLDAKRGLLDFAVVDGREGEGSPATEMALFAKNDATLLNNIKVVAADESLSKAIHALNVGDASKYDVKPLPGVITDEATARQKMGLAAKDKT